MNDEQLKQRIAYLVQHGGLLDNPLRSLQIKLRIALGLSATAVVLETVSLIL